MERTQLDIGQFSVALRKHVDPRSPAPLRMMAARGLVPMAPPEMATALYQLSLDADSNVKKAARGTMEGTPNEILTVAASAPLEERVLDWLGEVFKRNDEVLTRVILNAETAAGTLARIAKHANANMCDLIAENQTRLLKNPSIIEALYMNAEARMSTVDKIVDLARRNGVELKGLPALRGLMESDVPIVEPKKPLIAIQSGEEDVELGEEDERFGAFLQLGLMEEDEDEEEDEEETEEKESSKNRALYLSKLSVSQKVRVAILGSGTDRSLLVRDTNRLVHMAAVGSPKNTEREALNWSANRSMPDGVINYIYNRRDWLRLYQVKVSLINNPKLQPAKALKLLNFMHAKDLRTLQKNRNIPSVLSRPAKEL